MRVAIDLVSIIRQANLATDGTRKGVVPGSLMFMDPAYGQCGQLGFPGVVFVDSFATRSVSVLRLRCKRGLLILINLVVCPSTATIETQVEFCLVRSQKTRTVSAIDGTISFTRSVDTKSPGRRDSQGHGMN
jgi:hypothetical protein